MACDLSRCPRRGLCRIQIHRTRRWSHGEARRKRRPSGMVARSQSCSASKRQSKLPQTRPDTTEIDYAQVFTPQSTWQTKATTPPSTSTLPSSSLQSMRSARSYQCALHAVGVTTDTVVLALFKDLDCVCGLVILRHHRHRETITVSIAIGNDTIMMVIAADIIIIIILLLLLLLLVVAHVSISRNGARIAAMSAKTVRVIGRAVDRIIGCRSRCLGSTTSSVIAVCPWQVC